jgi:DNA-binding IclR family transcriptional regulator
MAKPNSSKSEMYDIASVKDAIRVLKEIAYVGRPVGVRELAAILNANPNKVFRLLATLLGEGLIEKSGDKYAFGYGMAELYSKYTHALQKIRDEANLKLRKLGETD